MKRIEIMGGIAAGKTTLTYILQSEKTNIVLEDFQSNPFLANFYINPIEYAFETELCFTLQHYHQIKTQLGNNRMQICDFSLFQDLAFAKVTLKDRKLKVYENLYNELLVDIPKPDLIVLLSCPVETQFKRIRSRAREVELGISKDYLKSINESIYNIAKLIRKELLIIDVNSGLIDYKNDNIEKNKIKEKIFNVLL